MPVLTTSAYSPPLFLRNGHVQTLYPVLFRKNHETKPRTERIETPDGDFLDLDWHLSNRSGSNRLVIVSHGLEGHARRPYVLGMARALNRRGWDVLAWTMRGCGAEPNRLLPSYHSGFTEDLHHVLGHALSRRDDADIALIGFSVGGNQILKYLGEEPGQVPSQVTCAVAISVPCDLGASARVLGRRRNRLYTEYFLKSLRRKIREKSRMFPDALDISGLNAITTFEEFDDRFTATIHGFAGYADYYRLASSKPYLREIRLPALILNAADDPFFSAQSFPRTEAGTNPNLFLEIPRHGGHVGFVEFPETGEYYSERQACEFLANTA